MNIGVYSSPAQKLRIHCTNQWLCDKPEGEGFCRNLQDPKDYHACIHFDAAKIMLMPPESIQCKHACNCEYAGKRPRGCSEPEGHVYCGVDVNGRAPEGELPKDIISKLQRAIPSCRIQPNSKL